MRRYSDRQSLHTLAELNVTPLLDLAFVLLIIFIITTPLMDNKMDVVLPSSNATQSAVDPNAVQSVTLHRDASITLNNRPVDLAELRSELAQLHAEKPEVAVVIRAHKDLAVQKLIDVMDVVQSAKIAKVGVVTQPEKP
ncbi:MAG TPA: biopolymer transporter ExbD [Chthoniobacteraceae bacterium]|jgi:biopolymer transport protein ExbD